MTIVVPTGLLWFSILEPLDDDDGDGDDAQGFNRIFVLGLLFPFSVYPSSWASQIFFRLPMTD